VRIRPLLREAVESARAQTVATVLVFLVTFAMCATVLLTQGRTAAANQQVLDTLDSAGTRSIIVRGSNGATFIPETIERLRSISAVEAAYGFGQARDSTNAQLRGGAKVPVRTAYGADLNALLDNSRGAIAGVYASPGALEQLGMMAVSGAVRLADGREYPVLDAVNTPEHLRFLDPVLLLPDPQDGGDGIAVLVIVATDASLVSAVTEIVTGLLDGYDRSQVTIETSAQLALVRTTISEQLAGSGQALTLMILLANALLVMVVLGALVLLRRRDYGRRRAIGATRSQVAFIVIAQACMISTVGSATGLLVSLGTLASSGQVPPISFATAVAVLTIVTATLASIVPASVAARRDPVRELRVP
jgi:putative ABC transport system permease protein